MIVKEAEMKYVICERLALRVIIGSAEYTSEEFF